MKNPQSTQDAKREGAAPLSRLADTLVPPELPARVATLDNAYAYKRDLQLVTDNLRASRELRKAGARQLAIVNRLIPRLQVAGKMRAAEARLLADRQRFAQRLAALHDELESREQAVHEAQRQLAKTEERLDDARRKQRDAGAAIAAQRAELEAAMRASVRAGDEAGEAEAARALAAFNASATDDSATALRIDEIQRIHEDQGCELDRCRDRLAETQRQLHRATIDAAAVETDAALVRMADAFFALTTACAQASAAGLDSVGSRFDFPSMTLRVMCANRVWFAPEYEGPIDVQLDLQLAQLHGLLSGTMLDLSVLAEPLPGVTDLGEAAAALM